jgi:glycerol-3-phosphate acyltransferase PlsY
MAAFAVLLSYLGGSVSFPYWVARLRGVDLRTVGSRKLGGSNLWKSVGPGEAIVGGLLDAAKGFVAVTVARALGLPLEIQLACGVAAVVGQMWPLFHRFDGGRANSAGWGFALAVDPIAILALILVRRVTAGLGQDLATGAPPTRVLANRALFDRSELQERGVVGI